ncbi:alcohol dehydrogenase catalytic domain-containing protein [Gracilibacillus dipsosauri]|uniref:alcohol dehydrogenase catalytic domain-containing protein n=1 Tax=Gracilibacillus dipsosauri TaxID=178340 RepID=UPI002409168E
MNSTKVKIIESKAYRLIKPWHFEVVKINHNFSDNEVVVRPTLASICHADLRYYTGHRRKEALEKKLPMALFHEGIGIIVDSSVDSLTKGQRVAIVPNIPARILNPETKTIHDDNYSPNGAFLGSGYDGIGQEHLVLPAENVVPIPQNVPDEIAVLAEICSVSIQAIGRIINSYKGGRIAVFGDGPVGFLTAAALHHIYNISKANLFVFGAIPEKLLHFDFATTHLVNEFDFKSEKGVEIVLECTGGKFSESAINQAIDLIDPQGSIVLMGVSEDRVPINTRDILEKGLTLLGSSRSVASDFKILMNHFQDFSYQQTLSKVLPEKKELIQNVDDLKRAMDNVVNKKSWQKTLLSFEW